GGAEVWEALRSGQNGTVHGGRAWGIDTLSERARRPHAEREGYFAGGLRLLDGTGQRRQAPARMKRFLRVRWFWWLLAPIVLLVGWWYLDAAIGEWRWNKYAAEARARGVKLTLAEMFPPKVVPDEEGYMASPMWQEMLANPNNQQKVIPNYPMPAWKPPPPD